MASVVTDTPFGIMKKLDMVLPSSWEPSRLRAMQVRAYLAFVLNATDSVPRSQDVYCYSCDDSKLDPEMAFHLSTFGINIHTQLKTEKTMTEIVSSVH